MELNIFIFFVGLILGSFSHTIALRMFKKESLWSRSHCDTCYKVFRWWYLIPVIGYFLTGGKCHTCKSRVTFFYPCYELFNATVVLLIFEGIGLQPHFFFLLLYWTCFNLLALIDWRSHLVFPGPVILIFIVRILELAIYDKHLVLDSFLGLTIGAGIFHFISYFYLIVRKKEGLGSGDATILGIIGFVFGWEFIFPVIILSSCLGIIFGLFFLLLYRKDMNQPIPFVPALVATSWFHLLYPDLFFSVFPYWQFITKSL